MKLLRYVIPVFFFAVGCREGEDEGQTARLMYAGTECPDASDVADAENMSKGTLAGDVPLLPPPLCWYHVDVNYKACEQTSTLSFDDLHNAERDDFKPTPDGLDPGVGRLFCIGNGELILLRQADVNENACALDGSDMNNDGVENWASIHMTATTLLKSDVRPGYHICSYALEKDTGLEPDCSGGGGVFAPE